MNKNNLQNLKLLFVVAKKIIKNILFWDDAPSGALFGVTSIFLSELLLSLPFSTLQWKFGCNIESIEDCCLIIFFYISSFLILRFYFLFCLQNYKHFFSKYIWMFITVISTFIYAIYDWAGSIYFIFFIMICIFLPFCLIVKVKFYYILLQIFAFIIGFFCFAYWLRYYDFFWEYFEHYATTGEFKSVPVTNLLVGEQWFYICVFSCVILLFAYILFIINLAKITGKRFFQTISLSSRILWAIYFISYSTFLFMAIYENRQVAKIEKKLENRLGKPLTAKTLHELYYKNEKPNKEFYEKLYSKLSSLSEKNANNFEGWKDKFISNGIPRKERIYKERDLSNVIVDELHIFYDLYKIEYNRIKSAIKNKDIKRIKKSFSNFKILREAMSHDYFFISTAYWINCERYYFYAIEDLLKTNLLTKDEWKNIIIELKQIEEQIPKMQEQAFLGEVIMANDLAEAFKYGLTNDNAIYYPLSSFRFLFPHYWWQYELEKKNLLKHYKIKKFIDFKFLNPNIDFLSNKIFCLYPKAIKKFSKFEADLKHLQGDTTQKWQKKIR